MIAQSWYAASAIVTVVVAVVHSVLGERLVFRRMRRTGIVPTDGGTVLLERNVRILWATWHLASCFGLALAACLWLLATTTLPSAVASWLAISVAGGLASGAVLVAWGTRFRHPGWIGLLLAAVLTLLGCLHSA